MAKLFAAQVGVTRKQPFGMGLGFTDQIRIEDITYYDIAVALILRT